MSGAVMLSSSSVATAPQSCFRSSGVLFPVLHRGSGLHSLANDGSLPDIRHLFRSQLAEVLDRPDVVFHLSLRAGAADGHVHAWPNTFMAWMPTPRSTATGSVIFSKLRYAWSAACSGIITVSHRSYACSSA